MATKLYFHDISNALAGTFPSVSQSATSASRVWDTTLRVMDKNTGSLQVGPTATSLANTTAQHHFIRWFCSPLLSGSNTVGGGTWTFNCAQQESNTNSNFVINGVDVYIWRPSTGALVNQVKDWAGASLGGVKPTAASSEQVNTFSFTTTARAALNGDVIICEVWAAFTQSMGTAYTETFFYDGTTENATQGTVVTSQASFLNISENLNFQTAQAFTYPIAGQIYPRYWDNLDETIQNISGQTYPRGYGYGPY